MDNSGNLYTEDKFNRMSAKARKRLILVGAEYLSPEAIKRQKVGRNEPCPCGSGKKFKKCHLGFVNP